MGTNSNICIDHFFNSRSRFHFPRYLFKSDTKVHYSDTKWSDECIGFTIMYFFFCTQKYLSCQKK
jgi:hypothetical protein